MMNRDKNEGLATLLAFAVMLMVVVVTYFVSAPLAHADIISEFGGGLKVASSEVFDPGCRRVFIVDADRSVMFDPKGRQKTVSCGGSNPVFVGWPIAWESPNGNTRVGWFHISHWFSGPPFNHDYELTMNCLCAVHKFHWSRK